jgi:hypothetical protein
MEENGGRWRAKWRSGEEGHDWLLETPSRQERGSIDEGGIIVELPFQEVNPNC